MRNEENNLLVKWLDDTTKRNVSEKLSLDNDMISMTRYLHLFNNLQITGKSAEEKWNDFLKKINNNNLSPIEEQEVSVSDSFI